MRRVTVYWWKGEQRIPVLELAQAKSPEIVLEWDKEFLTSSIELSPITFKKAPGLIQCPKDPFNGLPGFLSDNIPDGWGRILLRHAFQKKGLSLQDVSPLDMLSFIGDKGMGALSFEPALKDKETWAEGEIDLDELESEIEPIISGTPGEVIEQFISGGASPNGIRPKIIAKEQEGKFFIGDDNLKADEWLIKFRAPGDSPDSGKIEYIYSLLAREAGLRVPETKLISTNKDSFFAAKRFDREGGKRLHMHTLSGLLQVSPANYSISYEYLARVSNALTKNVQELEQVFRLAAFNVFSVNRDDHTKNVAFLMDEEGRWKLAPAYDLTFILGQNAEHKMAVNDSERPLESDLQKFGKDYGLSAKKVKVILDEVKASVSKFSSLAKKYGVSAVEKKRIEAGIEGVMSGKGLKDKK